MKIDPKTFRLVAGFLGGALLLIVIAISVLSGLGKDYPGILDNLATGCLTALVALLVSPRSDEPTPVMVTNQPVAVDPVDSVEKAARKQSQRRRNSAGYFDAVGIVVVVLVVLLILVLVGALR